MYENLCMQTRCTRKLVYDALNFKLLPYHMKSKYCSIAVLQKQFVMLANLHEIVIQVLHAYSYSLISYPGVLMISVTDYWLQLICF